MGYPLTPQQQKMLDAKFASIADAFDPVKVKAKQDAFIGPHLRFHGAWAQVQANIKARRDAEWEAERIEREAHRADMDRSNREHLAYLEAMRTGTPYERACYDEWMLNMKDFWDANDYAESNRIIARKRAARADLEVAA